MSGRGKPFEHLIEEWTEDAKRLGLLAHAEHTQAKTNVRKGGLRYEGSGVADYVLCLGTGAYGAVEAKSDEDDRLMHSRIEPLQARHLDVVVKAGALALLLAEMHVDGLARRFAVPWDRVPWKVVRSAESVSMWDILGWEIKRDNYLTRFTVPRLVAGVPVDFRAKRVYPRG